MDVLDLVGEESAAAPQSSFVPFAEWSEAEQQILRRHGAIEHLAAGAPLITQGERDRSLLIVVEGRLEVIRNGRSVHRVVPGELVGELAFVDGRPRSASVRADTAAFVFRFRPEDLEELAAVNPPLALKFLWEVARILGSRLRHEWG